MPYSSEYSEWLRKSKNQSTQGAWTAAIRFMESKFSSDNKQSESLLCPKCGIRPRWILTSSGKPWCEECECEFEWKK